MRVFIFQKNYFMKWEGADFLLPPISIYTHYHFNFSILQRFKLV